VVHRSLDRRTNNIVALKQVRIFDSDRGNGIPITALREISILKSGFSGLWKRAGFPRGPRRYTTGTLRWGNGRIRLFR